MSQIGTRVLSVCLTEQRQYNLGAHRAVDEHGLYGNTADEKFVHPPATGELDEGNGERHGKQPDDAIRVKVTVPGGHDYAHEAKEDFYTARQLQCSPERPDEGTRASRAPDD